MADVSLKLGLDQGGLQTGLLQAKSSISSFAGSVSKQLAGALSVTAIVSAISSVVDKAGQLQDISDKFGLSAESLQRIGNAAQESGGSIQDVATALARIGAAAQEAATRGTKELVTAFADIGVTGNDLVRLSPEQLFYRLANAMNDGSLAGKDLATAKQLLGRGFKTLLPVLRMTEEQIKEVGDATGVMADTTVARLDRIGDAWTRLKTKGTNALAALVDGTLLLAQEIRKNPLAFLTGDIDKLEAGIEAAERKDAEQIKNRREAMASVNRAAEATDPGAANLESENRKLFEDQKKYEANLAKERDKYDTQRKLSLQATQRELAAEVREEERKLAEEKKKQDQDVASRGLDALIAKKEAEITPAGAIASSLQRIGGLGEANIGVGTADSQLDELRALRNQLKEIEQRVPDTLDEIKNLLAGGGAVLS